MREFESEYGHVWRIDIDGDIEIETDNSPIRGVVHLTTRDVLKAIDALISSASTPATPPDAVL